jgi:hypothetical protein
VSANPVQTEAFKTLLRKLTKGYTFDVLGLYLIDGSHRALPKETSCASTRQACFREP